MVALRVDVSLTPKFETFEIRVSPGAADILTRGDVCVAYGRHLTGDWGDVDEVDWEWADRALAKEGVVTSRYHSSNGVPYLVVSHVGSGGTRVILESEAVVLAVEGRGE